MSQVKLDFNYVDDGNTIAVATKAPQDWSHENRRTTHHFDHQISRSMDHYHGTPLRKNGYMVQPECTSLTAQLCSLGRSMVPVKAHGTSPPHPADALFIAHTVCVADKSPHLAAENAKKKNGNTGDSDDRATCLIKCFLQVGGRNSGSGPQAMLGAVARSRNAVPEYRSRMTRGTCHGHACNPLRISIGCAVFGSVSQET
ncbi:hypothetical protein R3P38DRAFT_3085908 [Favolaschia claudopus]|uniref:Uncharacterized protein n=1 Tax=Favolaschia claudopus TaxID=2862362 RepID=A0AAV9ZVM5_9AGAR